MSNASTTRGSVSLKRPRAEGATTGVALPFAKRPNADGSTGNRFCPGYGQKGSLPVLSASSGLQNEGTMYHPQNQLVGHHRDRMCAFDSSMEKMGNSSQSDPQSNTVDGSNHPKAYRPLSYNPSTYENTQVQADLSLSPKPKIAEPRKPVPVAGTVAKPPTMAAQSPKNPYLKSNGTVHENHIGGRMTAAPSPSNPYTKPVTNALANSSKPSMNRAVSAASPKNPYLKSQQHLSNSAKPVGDRPFLSLSSMHPYQKKNGKVSRSPATIATTNATQLLEVQMPNQTHCTVPAAKKTLFVVNPYQKRRPPSISNTDAPRQPATIPTQRTQSAAEQESIVTDPPHQAVASSDKRADSNVVVLDGLPQAVVPASSVVQLSSNLASQVPKQSSMQNNTSLTRQGMRQYIPEAQSAMASIRPASWTSSKVSNSPIHLSNQVSFSNRPELPGEAHLPDELVYDPNSIKPIKDEYRSKLTINARLEKPLLNGWTLYRHQKRAILKGLMKRRVILALDMGLGKTLIGCVWSRAFKESFEDLKIIVVCPVTIKKEWKRTAENATGLRVEEEKKAPKDSLDLAIHSWAKIPTQVDLAAKHFIVVFDEAHAMQAMEANRTQAALKLVNDKRCVGVLLLTGTPMKNGKPCNLFPLLKAVRHPLGCHQKAYERHFCQGRLANLGRGQQWIASGQANLKQLHRLVESNLLHMTKDEYLQDLPPLSRETREVPISARCQRSYNEAVQRLASLKEALKTNKDLNSNALLGSTQDLRVICAFAKIRATVELAKDILSKEPSVVIFTNFAKAAQAIHKQLAEAEWDGALLTGDTPANRRQELVDGFQDEIYPAFISTFGAGGVGITLTKARTIILLDRPWTPGELVQAEDRIRRIGQQHSTRSIWMTAFEFDKQLDAMLEEKNQAAKAVLTKSEVSKGDTSSASINIPKLVAAIISKASAVMWDDILN